MQNDPVRLWHIEYKIGAHAYCANLPALNFEHARSMAESFGATATGGVLDCEVSALRASEVMAFVATICHDPPSWLYNAEEQLESFLSFGRPRDPEIADS